MYKCLIDPASLINLINQVNHRRKGVHFPYLQHPTPMTTDVSRGTSRSPLLLQREVGNFAPSVRAMFRVSQASLAPESGDFSEGMPASQASSQVRLYSLHLPLCTTQRRHSQPAPEGSSSPAMSALFVGCAAWDRSRSRSCSCSCMYCTLPPIRRCCFILHSYDRPLCDFHAVEWISPPSGSRNGWN